MTKLLEFDSGHGGSDPGASGYGFNEASDVLSFTLKVGAKLTAGYDVKIDYTRKTNRYVGLSARAAKANKLGADGFISFHENSFGKASANGFESYIHPYAGAATQKARDIIHAKIHTYNKPYGIRERGRKTANFAVLRETKASAILFENLFISNGADNKLQHNARYIEGLANAYAKGIAKAFGLPKKVTVAPKKNYGVVTASALHVRDKPTTDSRILGLLKHNESVRLGGHVHGWYNIYYGNHGGWVSDRYIK